MSELNKFEIEALRILNGEEAQVMGAWFNACCEVLKARDYATGIPYTITEKGKKYLADIDGSVPDVPELKRYRLHWSDFDTADMEIDNMEGEYVRYDQAATMLAAKDAEIKNWKRIANYETLVAQSEIEGRKAAEAKLAQYEAQEPVAWRHPDAGWTDVSKAEVAVHCKHGTQPTPLYASPAPDADLQAENERLREVLKKTHAGLEIDRTGRFEEFKNIINLALDGDANA